MIKMVISPKLNYLFSMLPISVPDAIFKTLDTMISQFIWAGKKARMKLKRLQAEKDCEGLRLPNLRLYQEAFTGTHIASLLSSRGSNPTWVCMEDDLMAPFKAVDYLSQDHKIATQNPIIAHTKDIWNSIHKRVGISPFLIGSASVWNNPKIKIGGKMFFWKEWHSKGISLKYLIDCIGLL